MIEVKNVSKQYTNVRALDGFECSFDHGITAILGPNGAGKSTLMSILSCENEASEGRVLWNGKDIKDAKKEYLSELSYMPQMQNLISSFTGYEFLYYIGYLKNVSDEKIKACIEKYQNALELTDCLQRTIRTYSGGMRQRLLFLSCLLSDPKVILLDEPTAGMDPLQRNSFKNIISEISSETAVIISTHIVQDVEDIAGHIIIMNHGKVISDTHKDTFRKEFSRYLYRGLLPKDKLERFREKYRITFLKNGGDYYEVRFISEEEIPGYKQCKVTLEDFYLSEIR